MYPANKAAATSNTNITQAGSMFVNAPISNITRKDTPKTIPKGNEPLLLTAYSKPADIPNESIKNTDAGVSSG